jgi:hypothetical protein
MAHSHRLSSGSVNCRLEWRPSRWLIGALLCLAVLAAFSVLASEMPRRAAWPLALAALAWGAWRAWRHAHLPPQGFVFPGNELAAMWDGQPIQDAQLQWRGPLAFLSWSDRSGQRQRLAWWPDTLPPARRRELRLAVGNGDAAPRRPGVAP